MEGEVTATMETFINSVTSLIEPVKSAMSLFLEPPIIFFVAAAGLLVVLSLVKKLLPMKKR